MSGSASWAQQNPDTALQMFTALAPSRLQAPLTMASGLAGMYKQGDRQQQYESDVAAGKKPTGGQPASKADIAANTLTQARQLRDRDQKDAQSRQGNRVRPPGNQQQIMQSQGRPLLQGPQAFSKPGLSELAQMLLQKRAGMFGPIGGQEQQMGGRNV